MIILSLIPLLKYLVISAVPLQCDNPEPHTFTEVFGVFEQFIRDCADNPEAHISTDDRNDDLTNYAGWFDFEDM